jgi:hypothetical protein
LCDLISDLSEEICWGSCQVPKIWVFDKNKGADVGLLTESQIPSMFMMYHKEKKISLLVVLCDSDGSSKYSDTSQPTLYPCTPSQPGPSIALSSQSQVGSSPGCNNSMLFSQSDDLDPNDYVGFNDEHMYDSNGEESLDQIQSVTNVTQEPHNDKDPLLENDVNPLSKNDMHKETTINDIVQAEPTIAYDLENSKIEYCFLSQFYV